ncbi:MAG: signal peptidase I [Fervidicoccaceae archaeon]
MSRISWKDVLAILLIVSIALLLKPALSAVSGTTTPIAVVKGNSMLPLLREGDIVFLHHVPPQDIAVGEVVVYQSIYGGYIIHRVVSIIQTPTGIFYVTKGDNNPSDDSSLGQFVDGPGIPYDRIVGVVWSPFNKTFVIPLIGIISIVI